MPNLNKITDTLICRDVTPAYQVQAPSTQPAAAGPVGMAIQAPPALPGMPPAQMQQQQMVPQPPAQQQPIPPPAQGQVQQVPGQVPPPQIPGQQPPVYQPTPEEEEQQTMAIFDGLMAKDPTGVEAKNFLAKQLKNKRKANDEAKGYRLDFYQADNKAKEYQTKYEQLETQIRQQNMTDSQKLQDNMKIIEARNLQLESQLKQVQDESRQNNLRLIFSGQGAASPDYLIWELNQYAQKIGPEQAKNLDVTAWINSYARQMWPTQFYPVPGQPNVQQQQAPPTNPNAYGNFFPGQQQQQQAPMYNAQGALGNNTGMPMPPAYQPQNPNQQGYPVNGTGAMPFNGQQIESPTPTGSTIPMVPKASQRAQLEKEFAQSLVNTGQNNGYYR